MALNWSDPLPGFASVPTSLAGMAACVAACVAGASAVISLLLQPRTTAFFSPEFFAGVFLGWTW